MDLMDVTLTRINKQTAADPYASMEKDQLISHCLDALGGKRSTSGRFACRRTTPKGGFQALTSKLTVY